MKKYFIWMSLVRNQDKNNVLFFAIKGSVSLLHSSYSEIETEYADFFPAFV